MSHQSEKVLETWQTLKQKIIRINQRKEEIQINQLSPQDQKTYNYLKNLPINITLENKPNLSGLSADNILLGHLLRTTKLYIEKMIELDENSKSIENL